MKCQKSRTINIRCIIKWIVEMLKVRKIRGCLDSMFSIIRHSKSMGPTQAALVWMSFHFLFPSLISHQIELWVSENEKKNGVFTWWDMSFDGNTVNTLKPWDPLSVCSQIHANPFQCTQLLSPHLHTRINSSLCLFSFSLLHQNSSPLSPYPSALFSPYQSTLSPHPIYGQC